MRSHHYSVKGISIRGTGLMKTALVLLLPLGCAVHPGNAFAANSVTIAHVKVQATVLERTVMKLKHQLPVLVITKKDMHQGYADVPEATMIDVKSNNPAGYLLSFDLMQGPTSNFFDSITVITSTGEVQLSPQGGYILRPYVKEGVEMKISYRLFLSKDAREGKYNWPVIVSVTSR